MMLTPIRCVCLGSPRLCPPAVTSVGALKRSKGLAWQTEGAMNIQLRSGARDRRATKGPACTAVLPVTAQGKNIATSPCLEPRRAFTGCSSSSFRVLNRPHALSWEPQARVESWRC